VFEILGSGKILQAQLILLVTNSLTIALLVLLFRRWQLLDDLRRRSEPPTVHVVDGLRLWVAYALGLGHLGGWLSWGHGRWLPDLAEVYRQLHLALHAHCPALLRLSPLGPGLYDGLVYGGLATIVHLGVRWAVFRVGQVLRERSEPDW
jgi:hypothetical protein